MPPKLHIVSFNVPLPANYGGVIDVFYRLKALSHLGVQIHLHCFDYGRGPAPELQRYCASVHYYKRRMNPLAALSPRPFIVQTRYNRELVAQLLLDDAPVLLEGLHSCALLEALRLRQPHRLIFVRTHNVEHDYYAALAHADHRFWKRLYLRSETRKLRRYEPVLLQADAIFPISNPDALHFQQLGCSHVALLPAAHPFQQVISKPGSGSYILYHADLSVAENVDALRYLANNIFSQSTHHFVVAGRNPGRHLQQLLQPLPNVQLVANPDNDTMQRLITDAHVILMITHQATGLKLKLLNSLFSGRHCLVNSLMVKGTSLAPLCTVADTAPQLRSQLDQLVNTPFTSDDIQHRSQILLHNYSNLGNLQPLLALIRQAR